VGVQVGGGTFTLGTRALQSGAIASSSLRPRSSTPQRDVARSGQSREGTSGAEITNIRCSKQSSGVLRPRTRPRGVGELCRGRRWCPRSGRPEPPASCPLSALRGRGPGAAPLGGLSLERQRWRCCGPCPFVMRAEVMLGAAMAMARVGFAGRLLLPRGPLVWGYGCEVELGVSVDSSVACVCGAAAVGDGHVLVQ